MMSVFIKIGTNEFPRYIGDVQLEHPDYTEHDVLPEGWAKVVETVPPHVEENQYATMDTPVFVDGEYVMQWKVVILTDDEVLQAKINALKYKLASVGLDLADVQFIASNEVLFQSPN
jgi:hypothetical protein